jgi:hypothetical protein
MAEAAAQIGTRCQCIPRAFLPTMTRPQMEAARSALANLDFTSDSVCTDIAASQDENPSRHRHESTRGCLHENGLLFRREPNRGYRTSRPPNLRTIFATPESLNDPRETSQQLPAEIVRVGENYLNLPAVEIGLRHLATIGMEIIHTRVRCLTGYLLETLQSMKHRNGAPLVQIYGPRTTAQRGVTIALNILTPDGRIVDERLVDRRAVRARIWLRTGCCCNPGAGESAFGITKQLLRERFNKPATNLDECIAAVGMQSAGAIRVSLGLVSNVADIYQLAQFVQSFRDSSPGTQDLPSGRQG